MHVALVSEHASPLAALGGADAGGQNVYVAALATELTALGCRVTVHTRRDDPHVAPRVHAPGGYVVHQVRAGPPRPLPKDDLVPYLGALARGLAASWRADRPDVVHAHFWMSGLVSLRAAARLGIPVAHTFHALGVVKRRHQGDADTSPPERAEAERHVAAQARAIIATCRDEVRELLALGAPPERLRVVPCGVDANLFRPGPAGTARAPVPPPAPGRHRLVAIGRLVPRKGIADAIAALALVPEAELVVAGGPPARELDADPEAVRLRRVAAHAGVAERVRFTGALDRSRVAQLLHGASLALCVPWYEPFGIVPLEAMASGVPVVGSAVGGLLDTVVPGETGLLVPPQRPEGIAAAVRELLGDDGRRSAMARAAVERVRSRYTWSAVATATLEVYEELLAGRRRVAPPAAAGGVPA